MSSYFSPSFVIGSIRIGTVSSASAFNIGNNWPTNFESNIKHNQGFGNVEGSNHQFRDAQSFLNDPDVFDMMNVSPDAEIPDWIKQMMQPSGRELKQTTTAADVPPASDTANQNTDCE